MRYTGHFQYNCLPPGDVVSALFIDERPYLASLLFTSRSTQQTAPTTRRPSFLLGRNLEVKKIVCLGTVVIGTSLLPGSLVDGGRLSGL